MLFAREVVARSVEFEGDAHVVLTRHAEMETMRTMVLFA